MEFSPEDKIRLDYVAGKIERTAEALAKLTVQVNHVAEVLRPGVDELHRRAVLESEVMQALSYQRHRIDRWEAALERSDRCVAEMYNTRWRRFCAWVRRLAHG